MTFAIPNGDLGSGLTIITGPNNAGKSSIIECLQARSGYEAPSFTVGARNAALDAVEIKYEINSNDEFIRSIKKGSSEANRVGIAPSFKVFVLPSRRAFNPFFGRAEHDRTSYLASNSLTAQRPKTLDRFHHRLFHTAKDPQAFNEILHQVLTYEPEWSIDQSDQGSYFLKFYNGGYSHTSDGMGEGIISIFAIADALHDSVPGDVVVIDEPELSLHPSLQKRLAALLCEYAKHRQIVIATHSPYFVDMKALSGGGHLARIVSGKDGTEIHQLSPQAKASLRVLSNGNLYNPHIFGLDARELFFQEDRIILTEGQEDVLLYPVVADQMGMKLEGSFFGWGAGGAGNISRLSTILRDLGFKRVAALLDGNKQAEVEKLRQEFPGYLFSCIPADDVRTKEAREATKEVRGLLDEKREVRNEVRSELERLFYRLAEYMNPVGLEP